MKISHQPPNERKLILPNVAAGLLLAIAAGSAISCKREASPTGDPTTSSATEFVPGDAPSNAKIADSTNISAGTAEPVAEVAEPKPSDAISKSDEAAALIKSAEWTEKRLAFYQEWAETAPAEAIAHAKANNPGASTACVSSALEGWMGKDRSAALSWAESQPPNAERSIWMEKLAGKWPADDLDSLAPAAASMAGSPAGQRVINGYANRLIETEPVKAFVWMHDRISDPGESSKAVTWVMGQWAARDTEKASGWLTTISPEEPWRDDAVAGLVEGVASLDPDTARQWATSIRDPERKKSVLQWLESNHSPIPPEL